MSHPGIHLAEPGMYGVAIRHNFETAHRLPNLGGKCRNLHGHSWMATITATAPALTADGTVVEFAVFKGTLRHWIDTYLDHGTMLGDKDPLVRALDDEGSKLLVFGRPQPKPRNGSPCIPAMAEHLDWPTVENVAILLRWAAEGCLATLPPGSQAGGVTVTGVHVAETAVNAATWTAQ